MLVSEHLGFPNHPERIGACCQRAKGLRDVAPLGESGRFGIDCTSLKYFKKWISIFTIYCESTLYIPFRCHVLHQE